MTLLERIRRLFRRKSSVCVEIKELGIVLRGTDDSKITFDYCLITNSDPSLGIEILPGCWVSASRDNETASS